MFHPFTFSTLSAYPKARRPGQAATEQSAWRVGSLFVLPLLLPRTLLEPVGDVVELGRRSLEKLHGMVGATLGLSLIHI